MPTSFLLQSSKNILTCDRYDLEEVHHYLDQAIERCINLEDILEWYKGIADMELEVHEKLQLFRQVSLERHITCQEREVLENWEEELQLSETDKTWPMRNHRCSLRCAHEREICGCYSTEPFDEESCMKGKQVVEAGRQYAIQYLRWWSRTHKRRKERLSRAYDATLQQLMNAYKELAWGCRYLLQGRWKEIDWKLLIANLHEWERALAATKSRLVNINQNAQIAVVGEGRNPERD